MCEQESVMADMSKFLESVFKIQRMRAWRIEHPERWQQFSDWAGSGAPDSGKLNSDQRKWLSYIKRVDPNDDKSAFVRRPDPKKGFLEIKDYPAFTELDDAAWQELYLNCQNTWYQMKHDKSDYKDSVIQFIADNAKYFDDYAEGAMEATTETENAIQSMIDLLEKVAVTDSYVLSNLGVASSEITKLKDAVAKKKYNKDADFRKKMMEIASKIVNATDETKNALNSVVKANFAPLETLSDYIKQPGKNLNIIPNEYSGWNMRYADDTKIREFKQHYLDFLQPIYSDENVFKAFDAKETGKKPVTSAINKAKKDIDYDDKNSKNQIPPKRQDEMNLVEQIQKWAGDKYEDFFKKYKELRGAKILEHPDEVNAVLKRIDKEGIKPTDDLNKLAGSADKITKALRQSNPKAANAFEWLADALKDFSADPNMTKTMAGALKSGRKMHNLVQELVIRAADNPKDDTVYKAKVAMEILSVMQYGATTSKIMDSLKNDKELFTFFSNKDLSWNKNEGVQFITTAMDKTFRAACLGIGYGATIVTNFARKKYKSRFNRKLRDPRMKQAYDDWGAENNDGRDKARADVDADNGVNGIDSPFKKQKDDATTKRDDAMNWLRDPTGGGYTGNNEEVLKKANQDINALKGQEWTHQNEVDTFSQLLSDVSKAQSIYEELEGLTDEENAIVADASLTDIQKQAKLTNIESKRDNFKKELTKIGYNGKLDLSLINNQNLNLINNKKVTSANLENIYNYVSRYDTYQNAQTNLGDVQQKIYDRQQNIDNYHKAIDDINAAEKQIKERKKKLDDWDKNHHDVYRELMAYWDTLQNPRLKRYGLRSASAIQDSNKTLVSDLFNKKLQGYTLN